MAFRYKHRPTDNAELDITSFMNLMIVLVPVLLLSLTFTQLAVHEIELPELTGGSVASAESQAKLEVMVTNEGFSVYYPDRGNLVKQVPLLETEAGQAYDYLTLSAVMQEIKNQLSDRRDVVVLAAQDLAYQDLVSTMDAVKSYRTVVAANVVEVELFPEISLGDAS
ncbi:biopolymer transporter ExbD [Proteobacteria bacterium 005FR1]|nr:biopolymer transporter ExbD [Proteobacteria bacterium 005FR1]